MGGCGLDVEMQVNTLNERTQAAFEELITRIETDSSIRGVVLRSGKDGNFIAGADISMLVRGSLLI